MSRTAIRTCKDVSLFVKQARQKFQKKKGVKQRAWKEIAKEID